MSTKKSRKATVKTRTVLIILCNRWNPKQKPLFLEVKCDPKGTVLNERRLGRAPTQARYDEVWENDEGRSEFAACHRFKRKYGHKLQKPS